MVRALNPSEYGAWAVAVGLAGMLVMVADLGMTASLARHFAGGMADRGIGAKIAFVRAGLAIASAAILALAGAVIHAVGDESLGLLLIACAPLAFAQGILGFASGLLPTLRAVPLLIAATIAISALEMALVIGVVTSGGGALEIVIASTLAATIVGVPALLLTVRNMPTIATAPGGVVRGIRPVLRYGGPLLVVAVCYAAFGQIDQIVITAFHGTAAVAAYAATWKLIAMLHLPGFAVATVIAPRLADSGSASRPLFSRTLRALAIAYAIGIGATIAVADIVIPVALGSQYANDWRLLVGLAPYAFLLGLAPLVTMSANFLGGAGDRVRIAVATIAINIALDIALVPSLGAWGAVIGTSVAMAWYVYGHVRIDARLLAIRRARAEAITVAALSIGAGLLAFGCAYGAREALQGTLGEYMLLAIVLGIAAAIAGWCAWRALMPAPRAQRAHAGIVALHISDFAAPYPGAFIRQLRMLDDRLRAQSGKAILVFPERARDAQWLSELRAEGREVLLIADTSPMPRRSVVRQVRECIAGVNADVVHSHFGSYDIAIALACAMTRRAQRPVQVWHYRTALEEPVGQRSVMRRFKDLLRYRIAGAGVDTAIGVTEAVADEVAARGLGARAVGIVSGCDTTTFCADDEARERTRDTLGVSDDTIMLLHLGWAWHRKGGDVLAEALRLVEQERPDVAVTAFSVGAPEQEVEAPVVALASTNDIQTLHQASDIFISASRSEAFGNGLVEAMACERVAVAAAADGQVEIFGGLDGCRVIPPGDAPALASSIIALIDTRTSWRAWGAANRQRILDRYDMQRWAHDIVALYESLIGTHGPEAAASQSFASRGRAA